MRTLQLITMRPYSLLLLMGGLLTLAAAASLQVCARHPSWLLNIDDVLCTQTPNDEAAPMLKRDALLECYVLNRTPFKMIREGLVQVSGKTADTPVEILPKSIATFQLHGALLTGGSGALAMRVELPNGQHLDFALVRMRRRG